MDVSIKKFVKPKENEDRYHRYLFLLQNFDESCLEVRYSRAGEHEDSNMYSIKYQKFGEKEIFHYILQFQNFMVVLVAIKLMFSVKSI